MKNALVFEARPQAAGRLICLPYAGGGASVFRQWHKPLPPGIEVAAVQLPGRESRYAAPRPEDLPALARQCVQENLALLDKPFVLFGHSMGSLIAFEMALALRQEPAAGLLRGVIVAGARAPDDPFQEPPIHALPEPEFVEELRKLNGISEQVLAHKDLLRLVLPTLRADFRWVETYRWRAQAPLEVPLAAYGGEQDSIARDDLALWARHTRSAFQARMLPGDHFFIQSSFDLLMTHLADDLAMMGLRA